MIRWEKYWRSDDKNTKDQMTEIQKIRWQKYKRSDDRNTKDQMTEILMISWQLTLLQTLRVCPRCRRLLSIHEIQHGRIITAPPRLQPPRATGACQQGKGGCRGPAARGAGQGGQSRGADGPQVNRWRKRGPAWLGLVGRPANPRSGPPGVFLHRLLELGPKPPKLGRQQQLCRH